MRLDSRLEIEGPFMAMFGFGGFASTFYAGLIQNALDSGDRVPQIYALQRNRDSRVEELRDHGSYRVVLEELPRGDGTPRRQVQRITCVRDVFAGDTEPERYFELFRSPHLSGVITNTAERGFEIDDADRENLPPEGDRDLSPHFPVNLARLLFARYLSDPSHLPLDIFCGELKERNAHVLQDIVLQLVDGWQKLGPSKWQRAGSALLNWLQESVRWCSTLVDQIVPKETGVENLIPGVRGGLTYHAEAYREWVVTKKARQLGFINSPDVIFTPDITPYALRKLRLLNGGDVVLVYLAEQARLDLQETSRASALKRRVIADELARVMAEEIQPVIADRCRVGTGIDAYRELVFKRLRNPGLDYRLAKIACVGDRAAWLRKLEDRIVPNVRDARERGIATPVLEKILAHYDVQV